MQTHPTPSAHVCTPHHAGYCLTAEFAQEVAKTAKGVEAAKAFLGFLNEFVPALGNALQATTEAHIALAREVAHRDACVTLPLGNTPMRDKFPTVDWPDRLMYVSDCGRVHQTFTRAFDDSGGAPVGTWRIFEQRTDEVGEKWTKQNLGAHYVVDDFGFLARVDGKGGAA